MNSVCSRANNCFNFSTNVMMTLAFGCYITTVLINTRVPVDIHVTKVMLRNVYNVTGFGEPCDMVYITFDYSANLQPAFNWNVLKLYIFVFAEYATPKNALNQVMLWDKTVYRGKDTLYLRDQKSKYFFCDDGNGLRAHENITLTLSWNIIPVAGSLAIVLGNGYTSLPFPKTYETPTRYL
ncbi:signal peptidase complex subunit 3-like [Syngnathus typhle]